MVTRPQPHADRDGQAGYTLAALAVAVTVMSILTAMALPVWSKAIQREKEEELIARGLQYAEAIRVFRTKFGRAPVRLQELVEVKPRSLRRLWRDPMMEDGEWGLLLEGGPVRPGSNLVPGTQPQQPPGSRRPPPPGDTEDGDGKDDGRGDQEGRLDAPAPPLPVSNLFGDQSEAGNQVTVGPIVGVVSRSRKESIKLFFDKSSYDQWQFRWEILVASGGFNTPGGSGLPVGTRPQWIGRPWRPGIVPPGMGQVPGQAPIPGQPGSGGFGTPGGAPVQPPPAAGKPPAGGGTEDG